MDSRLLNKGGGEEDGDGLYLPHDNVRRNLLRAPMRRSFIRLMFESPHANGLLSHLNNLKHDPAHSALSVMLMRLAVTSLRLVTPLAYAHTFFIMPYILYSHCPDFESHNATFVWKVAASWHALSASLLSNPWALLGIVVVSVWALLEVLFLPYYWYMFRKLSRWNHNLPHIAHNEEGRRRLAVYSIESVIQSAKVCPHPDSSSPDSHIQWSDQYPHKVHLPMEVLNSSVTRSSQEYMQKFIEGWFLEMPIQHIKYGNLFAWSAWAFFNREPLHLTDAETAENHVYVSYMEKHLGHSVMKGFTPTAPPIRLQLDPMFVTQRPLCLYAFAIGANKMTHMILSMLGYTSLSKFSTKNNSQHIYHRKATANSPPGLPVVFIHGIGMGFFVYLALICALPTDIDVFLVEWPNVSMQMVSEGPVPDEAVTMLVAALDAFRVNRAVFMAHSLGTSMVSWMLKHPVGALKVGKSIILDPIIFLLNDPTVASVFVYRDPHPTFVDHAMHYFFSRELFISHALSRHFSWSHNILFVEDLYNNRLCCQRTRPCPLMMDSDVCHSVGSEPPGSNFGGGKIPELAMPQCPIWQDHLRKHQELDHTIILSSHDSIVPVGPIFRYMQAKAREGHRNFEVVIAPGCHGEMLAKPQWLSMIMSKLHDYCFSATNHQ